MKIFLFYEYILCLRRLCTEHMKIKKKQKNLFAHVLFTYMYLCSFFPFDTTHLKVLAIVNYKVFFYRCPSILTFIFILCPLSITHHIAISYRRGTVHIFSNDFIHILKTTCQTTLMDYCQIKISEKENIYKSDH